MAGRAAAYLRGIVLFTLFIDGAALTQDIKYVRNKPVQTWRNKIYLKLGVQSEWSYITLN